MRPERYNPRMRIAVNALSVVPGETGGGETYLVELLRAMEGHPAAAGHEIVVYCSENAADLYRERGAVRRRVIPIDNRGRLGRLLFEHLRLGRLLVREGADVLYAPGNALPLRLRTPAVLGVQSLHSFVVPEEMSRFRVAYFRRIAPRSARRAQRILCVSDDIRRLLLREVPGLAADKVRVVYEGAPQDMGPVGDDAAVDAACGRFGVERDRFVLFVSSLNPFKRPERAIEAVAWWRDNGGEPWPLLLAGRASDEHSARVHAAASAVGSADATHVLGTVGRSDLSALLTGARVMVYPSTVETFGLPPLEAMACGTPVVASDRSCIPEIVGDAALLVDPDDVPAFGAALGRALHDDTLRAELIAHGRARVACFQWSTAAAETLALLEEAAVA
jgi:glycosyltransferase involved in cell wall biosynthesis